MLTAWQLQRASQSFYNTTGETIPPYACMELDYFNESGLSANEIPTDTQNLFWRVKKPTSSAVTDPGRVVFNGPTQVGPNGYGELQVAGFLLAAFDSVDGAPVVGSNVGPKNGSWYLTANQQLFPFVSYDSGRALYESESKRSIWIRSDGAGAGDVITIEFIVTAAEIIENPSSPYDGMLHLTVTVKSPSCNATGLWNTTQDVYEHEALCLLGTEEPADLIGRKGTAYKGVHQDMSTGASPGDLTPCHFVLQGICCP
jgi:hypothetical protein